MNGDGMIDEDEAHDTTDVGFAHALSMDQKSGLPGNELAIGFDDMPEDEPRNNFWYNNAFWGTIGIQVVNRSLDPLTATAGRGVALTQDTLLLSADSNYELGGNGQRLSAQRGLIAPDI